MNDYTDIVLAIDYGGSLTKVVFSVKSSKRTYHLAMEPEVSIVSRENILNYERSKMGETEAERRSWVGVSEIFYAVGSLAYKFNGNAGLRELKYEKAVFKTLAAVWVISQKLNLLGKCFKVDLCCLLPLSEFSDKKRFEQLLKEGLSDFITPTGRYSCTLTEFNCKPEGAGIYLLESRQNRQLIQSNNIAIVMVGHRNSSIMQSFHGDLQLGQTSELGFIRLIEAVSKQSSGLDLKSATEVIAAAGYPPDLTMLRSLSKSTAPARRDEDMYLLRDTVEHVRNDYIRSLSSWVRNNLDKNTKILLMAGGASLYLKGDLEATFEDYQVIWNTPVALNIYPKTLNLVQNWRFYDIYGFYLYFLKLLTKNSKET